MSRMLNLQNPIFPTVLTNAARCDNALCPISELFRAPIETNPKKEQCIHRKPTRSRHRLFGASKVSRR
jgi:hypothetical protein